MLPARSLAARWHAAVRPPQGLLAYVQWMLLALAIIGLGLGVVIIAVFSNAEWLLRICALAAIGWLAWWLISGYREAHFPLWKDLLAIAALFVAGVGAGDSEGALGVLYAALYLRCLYASPEGTVGVALGFTVANLSALAVVAGRQHAWLTLANAFTGALGLAMAAVVIQVLRTVIARRQVAQHRETSMRRTALELLGAGSSRTVYRAARRLANELVAEAGPAQLALVVRDGLKLELTTSERSADGAVHQAQLEAGSVDLAVLETLLGTRTMSGSYVELERIRQTLQISPQLTEFQLLPLLSGGQPGGSLALATSGRLQRDQLEVLQILADECSLALSRASLSEDLRRSEGRFRSLVHNSSDLILAISESGELSYVSPSAEALLGGRHPGQAVTVADLLYPSDLERFAAVLEETRQKRGRVRSTECRVGQEEAGWRHFELFLTNLLHDPYVSAVVVNGRDITERRQLEDQLRHQALHDPLTGLANRALLRDRLEHALRTRRDARSVLGLLSVDLDNFKEINDSYGHAGGDAVLLEVTRRIAECLRPADTFARLGGDEFAVLIEKVSSQSVAREIARRVEDSLARPIRIAEDSEVMVSVSVGLLTAKYATADAEAVLRDADIALYQAKSEGKGRYIEFHPNLHQRALDRVLVETGLRRALEGDLLRLRFQPILSGIEHRLVGVEALLRWQDPDREEAVLPSEFIEVAEATGLIVPIGRWVLYEACRQMSEWCRRYPRLRSLRLSVNVSPRQLHHASLVADVRGALSGSGLDPRQLVLEVTESTIVQDVEHASVQLGALRLLGIRVAIDDFGTGQSSLAQLQHLPVDELKIDRSFMERLSDGSPSAAVAESVVQLGRALALAVVVEGVETAEQVKLLEGMGSGPLLQGFFFAQPLEPAALEAMIAKAFASDAELPDEPAPVVVVPAASARTRGKRARPVDARPQHPVAGKVASPSKA